MKRINFIIFILSLLLSCKSNNSQKKQNIKKNDSHQILKINKDCLKNRKITNIVQSCGGGCSIIYNEKKIILEKSLIKIKFDAITYIYEKEDQKFDGYFYVNCESKKAKSIFFEDSKEENILNVNTNSMSASFKPYANSLCECLTYN